MSQQELLKRVVVTLSAAGIDYMVTGSVASSLQGQPRSTHDIDLVIRVTRAGIETLLAAFQPPDYYLDRASIDAAVETEGMFNLLHVTGGEKVDFWMLTNDAFDQSRFARKYKQDVEGVTMNVSRPRTPSS